MPRGGTRPGAGRKRKTEQPAIAAALRAQRAVAQHRVDTKVKLDAAMPVEIMLDNMRFAHTQAQNAAQEIARIEQDTGQMADILLYKTMMSFRVMAQRCAEGAAPYLHPRLAAVAHLDPPDEANPKTPDEFMAYILNKIDGRTRGLSHGRAATSEPSLQRSG